MESDNPKARTSITEVMDAVDRLKPSPSQRASEIWEILHAHAIKRTDWDLVCFCAEFLGHMVSVHPWLKEPVRELSRLVYQAHYVAQTLDQQTRSEPEREFGGDLARAVRESLATQGGGAEPSAPLSVRDNRGGPKEEGDEEATWDDGSRARPTDG